jgi:hypothetical protein
MFSAPMSYSIIKKNEIETFKLITNSENFYSNICQPYEWSSIGKNKIVGWLERAKILYIYYGVVLGPFFYDNKLFIVIIMKN